MLMLFGFLVVAVVLSLPDVDSVGRTQNQNTGKKDGEKNAGLMGSSPVSSADAEPSAICSRKVTLVT